MRMGKGPAKLRSLQRKLHSDTQGWAMKPTSLREIANKAANDKGYRFQNLFRMLTTGFLLWCWQFIRKNAASGVDRQDARSYQQNLQGNIEGLVAALKGRWYRAKLVLRRYIPKANGKMRPLGIPAIADKVLQRGVAKILEAIFEQDFLGCSYGYRPKRGALDAVRDLSAVLRTGKYQYIVEADIRGFFDNIDHNHLLKMLEKRIEDRLFLNLIRKWLKAGILETDGSVTHPATGTPQGGIVSPILANIYLHSVLDVWVQETGTTHYRGAVYLCRYADDFVCAFQYESDAWRFFEVLGKRLGKYGLELAEEKTNLIRFSPRDRRENGTFEFLGFEFRWDLGRWGKPVIKRRTARKKYRVSLVNMEKWCRENCHKPKAQFFAELNAKLRGYYNYYGIRGNYESLGDFYYWIKRVLHRVFNRRSQRKSITWTGLYALIEAFHLQRPRICHHF
jgi:RNA-directed DNA polymerase